jgi:murein L,D-transpeptidase YafK
MEQPLRNAIRHVLIQKSDRRLRLYEGDREIRRVPVVVGRNPGDKEREGDLATPEGDFYICYKNPASRYHRFLGLSYPNAEDADRGWRAGVISAAERQAIIEALTRRGCPPWQTALGGEVGLHGPCPNVTWTHGCIAMSVEEIEFLYDFLQLGDPVTIQP